eukprot:m.59580 g.59580  ORF g.59580 m.59580 type:complete len:247 (-) comp13235_c2_seq1:356-1096(-)
MAGESHRLSPHVDLENSLGKRLDNEDNGDERRSSCASYAARTCSTIGLICVVIAIATPSWINQILTVQAGGNQSADITIGRGFFQMYYYDHHGLFLLYNNREHDFAGQSADVFCGPSNATTQFPLLEPVSRHNNERDWCGKRAAALGLSLTIATLGVFAFASSHLMGYGCGDDSILFLFTSIAGKYKNKDSSVSTWNMKLLVMLHLRYLSLSDTELCSFLSTDSSLSFHCLLYYRFLFSGAAFTPG